MEVALDLKELIAEGVHDKFHGGTSHYYRSKQNYLRLKAQHKL